MLYFLDEPDAIAFISFFLVAFQRLKFGLHHGAALSLNNGLDGYGVPLQEIDSLHVRLHGRLPNHLLAHLFVIMV
jgi:hypothetical protein